MSEPKVTYVQDQDHSETSVALVKKVEKDPDSNIVEFIEGSLGNLKDACDNQKVLLD